MLDISHGKRRVHSQPLQCHFVYSGCYNNNTTDWVAYRHLFVTVLVTGKSTIKALADSVSDEGSLPGSYINSHHIIMSSCGKGDKKAL